MSLFKYVVPAIFAITATGFAHAEDLDGAKLFNDKTCASCHGAAGNAPIMGAYPKLAGQNAEYLVAKLKAYKAGEVTGNQAAVMTPMAAMLESDEQIEAVAKYLAEAVECKEPE